jgi:hypothetical protein
MRRTSLVLALASSIALVGVGLGYGSSATAQSTMSFFLTSANPGKGADLGGLAGADAHCQALASALTAPAARPGAPI